MAIQESLGAEEGGDIGESELVCMQKIQVRQTQSSD